MGFENPINVGVTMGNNKFKIFSENHFVEGTYLVKRIVSHICMNTRGGEITQIQINPDYSVRVEPSPEIKIMRIRN